MKDTNKLGQTETVLYGLPKHATERYDEELLLTNATPELIEKVKALATKDGFHSFRVAEIDLSVAPNFKKALNSRDKIMKAYQYTIYNSDGSTDCRIVTKPGEPAPEKLPKEYKTLRRQLQVENWDMRDSTAQDVRPLNNSIQFAQMSRQVN